LVTSAKVVIHTARRVGISSQFLLMLNTRSTWEDDLSSIMVHIAQKQKYKWNSQRAAISLCKRWAAFLFSFTQHLLPGSFFIHVQCAMVGNNYIGIFCCWHFFSLQIANVYSVIVLIFFILKALELFRSKFESIESIQSLHQCIKVFETFSLMSIKTRNLHYFIIIVDAFGHI
jgi:hypothetical protein